MSTSIRITREIVIPDPVRVARAERSPDLGPRILFFSGGTALRETSQNLVAYTHNSIHLVTPFDSGGSSAVLRKYFNMPAVGDLRFRLMALADRTLHGYPEIFDLFAYRLPKTSSPDQLRAELHSLVTGSHPRITPVSDPMRKIIRHHLQYFEQAAGPDFDLRGASVGNLILTAGYLDSNRHIDPIVFIYSKLVQVRGEVRLLINSNLHLQATLASGNHIVGQHLITGKETPMLSEPITDLCLVDPAERNAVVRPMVRDKIRKAIRSADLICYPMGSFYSSLVANLLPGGVGQAIADTPCPKVYIPNTFTDPESIGLTLATQVKTLLHHLRKDAADTISASDVLDFVLLDPDVAYPGVQDALQELTDLGVRVVITRLTRNGSGAIDPKLLCRALVSLA